MQYCIDVINRLEEDFHSLLCGYTVIGTGVGIVQVGIEDPKLVGFFLSKDGRTSYRKGGCTYQKPILLSTVDDESTSAFPFD